MNEPTAPAVRPRLALLLVLILASLPRLVTLGADVLPSAPWTAILDEGYWAHNARNHALYGVWVRDQHNPALLLTPAWTGALSLVYATFGVGLAQTRLLSAVSGIVTSLVLYLGLRRRMPVTAFAAAIVLSLGYFTTLLSRAAYTETFQMMFITVAFILMLAAVDRPRIALLAGVFAALSLLAKPSAALAIAAFLAAWLLHWMLSRKQQFEKGPEPSVFLWFALGGGAVLGIVGVALVLPHWQAFADQIGVSLRSAAAPGQVDDPASFRVSLYGLFSLGLVRSRYFTQGAVPLLAVAGLAVTRLTGGDRTRMSVPEFYAWMWLGLGLLALSAVAHQPDRRFLFLAPAVAILAAQVIAEGGVRLGDAPSRWRWSAAGALLFTLVAFLCHPAIARLLTSRGLAAGLGRESLASLIVSSALVIGAALGVLAARRGIRLRHTTLPWWAFAAAFLVLEPARLALGLAHPTYTMRNASRDLGRLTKDWAPDEKVFIGLLNATLSLENDIFPLIVRDDPERHIRMNVAPETPYHPTMTIVAPWARDTIAAYEQSGFAACRTYPLRPGVNGVPARRVTIMVRKDLAGRCGAQPGSP